MRKIKSYRVETYNNYKGLIEEIKALMDEGWQPFGGLQVNVPALEETPAPLYSQALVQYDG